ncbi:CRISPR-associated ring nuclease [Methylacidiphilum caldifontis]|uniref:Uncharacterized protein n=1 Tax=Methylacidiphilum caldifontis TaxID=2795386 RepID=A0A4Y8P6W1_9BACT|nr:CRISPR-associated ring nuclease [Methylacidiphilum caldifontis]TFE65863.1 hypothetical protein A7Q10_02540 [Methylacidiphilum caldifontis]
MEQTSNIVLSTLGETWIVALEVADYKKNIKEVHCITGTDQKIEQNIELLINEFASNRPDITLGIWQIEDFDEINSCKKVQLFKEILFRWYLRHFHNNSKTLPYVSIGGGMKFMAATLQKAASLFGAEEVFQVLSGKTPPQNSQDYNKAKMENKVVFAELGKEPGFEELRELRLEDFPLNFEKTKNAKNVFSYLLIPPDNQLLVQKIDQLIPSISKRAKAWKEKIHLPFPILALGSKKFFNWLNSPLDLHEDEDWIKNLPKVDLHTHLGGFATHGHLLTEVQKAAHKPLLNPPAAATFPSHWPHPKEPIGLEKYIKLGDATGSNLLKDPGCLKKHCQLLYEKLCEDNVIYCEIRCSPNNYADPEENRSAWLVLQEIQKHFQESMDKRLKDNPSSFCQVNLIIIADRKSRSLSSLHRHISLAITAHQHFPIGWGKCVIVGVDLAGFESKETRAELFAYDFTPVHRCGIAVTAHAGENDDAEGIWQAIYKLHARRLGHALSLKNSPELLQSVIERQIGIEMCPYANYQIKGFKPMEGKDPYPLLDYHNKGVLVSVNTDNIGISQANLTQNFLFLATLCEGITKLNILQILSNSIKVAFIPYEIKQKLNDLIEEKLEDLVKKYS